MNRRTFISTSNATLPGSWFSGDLNAVSYERELKAAMQEWMILQRDFLPLPVTPTEGPGAKKDKH